ncbi:MAG: prepilin peptidase [Chloroflexota bacterium]
MTLVPLVLILGLSGLAVGSFLNLCIDRLPRGQSIISPSSHCPVCNRRLGIVDMVPVLNYLWLRGRCRTCRAPIPYRLPLVELATGLLFAFLAWYLGPEKVKVLAILLVYASLLVIIFVIDWENQLILNRITYPAMVLALGFSFLWPDLTPLKALTGGAIGLAAMLLPYILFRQGMGLGDVKLGALVGLMTGYPLVFVNLLLGVLAGGVVSALLLGLHLRRRRDALPFAPFLTTATLITLLWGEDLWQWYWNWPAILGAF